MRPPRRRMLTKLTDCQRDEKACKSRKQTCRQGSLHGVSDRRLHVQLTQKAKIAPDFSLFRAIFAFAGFVSALSRPLSGGFLFGFMPARKGFTAAPPYSLLSPFLSGKNEYLAHGCKLSCIPSKRGALSSKNHDCRITGGLTEPHRA